MWECRQCGALFEEPVNRLFVKECPKCKSEDILDVSSQYDRCECCGQMVKEVLEDGICSRCSDRLYEVWEKAVKEAMQITHKGYCETAALLKKHIKLFKED